MFAVHICALSCWAQYGELRTIEIGTLSTTHVVFTSDLTYVDISKPDVIRAIVVDASKNMLAIKAREPFDYVTTVSALEANGTMHTFKVRYNAYPEVLIEDMRGGAAAGESSSAPVNTQIRPGQQPAVAEPVPTTPSSPSSLNITTGETSNFGRSDAPTLEEIMKYPQKVFHVGDRSYKLEAYVTNLFVYSDLIYVVITLFNKSDIGYEAGEAQFTIENVQNRKNNLNSNKSLWAHSSYGSLSCAPQGVTTVGYTIPKFTLLRNECLRIYIYEKNGTRNLVLTLDDRDVNYAVSPK